MEKTKILTPRQASTFVITFILVVFHVINELLLSNSKDVSSLSYYSLGYIFILLAVLMYINRDDLSEINVDSVFYFFFIVIGGIYSSIIQDSILSLFVLIAIFILFGDFSRKKVFFGDVKLLRVVIFSLITIIPYFLFYLFTGNNIQEQITSKRLIYDVVYAFILVSYWELVFRGVIWYLLRINLIGEKKFFIVQLLIFWCIFIIRSSFDISPFLLIPLLIGVWHSFIVLYTKSIFPTVIAWSIFFVMSY